MQTLTKTKPTDFQWAQRKATSTISILNKVSFEAVQEIDKYAIEKKYSKRETVFREDDPAEFVWFVLDGYVKEVHYATDGQVQTLCMIGANGMFGVSAFEGGNYGFYCLAETDVTVLSFPIQSFRAAMRKDPDMAETILTHVSKLLRRSKNIQVFARDSAEKRLIRALVELVEEFGRIVPLTRIKFAQMAGTSVETCIRVFTRLEDAGLITSTQGKLMVNDLDKLIVRIEKL